MAAKRSTKRATRPLGSGRPAFINGSSLAIQASASASSSRVAPVAMIFAITTSSSSPNSAVTSLRVSVLMAASQMVASADRHGNETHRLARSQPQQNNLLACVARFTERAFDLGRRLHRFAADLEDDVAKLKSALRPERARLDVGDHDALLRTNFVLNVGDIDLRRGQPLQGLGYIAGPDAPCGTISEFHHMAPIVLLDLHRRSPYDRMRAFWV